MRLRRVKRKRRRKRYGLHLDPPDGRMCKAKVERRSPQGRAKALIWREVVKGIEYGEKLWMDHIWMYLNMDRKASSY
jgi:hypothetical protein